MKRTVWVSSFGLILAAGASTAEPVCSVSEALPDGSTFVGFTRPAESTLRSFALLFDDGRLQAYDGNGLFPAQPLHGLLTESLASIEEINPYLNRLGKDHCVYAARLSWCPDDSWEIWTSGSEASSRIRLANNQEAEDFHSYEHYCVIQGDPVEVVEPSCPKLVAVSDLNEDKVIEYWHTVPYTWDTGLQVSKEGANGRLVPLMSACPGCSD